MVNNKRISLFTIHLTAADRCITFSQKGTLSCVIGCTCWCTQAVPSNSSWDRFSPLSCSCMRPLVHWKASSRASEQPQSSTYLGIFHASWNSPSSTRQALASASVQSPTLRMWTLKWSSWGAWTQYSQYDIIAVCSGHRQIWFEKSCKLKEKILMLQLSLAWNIWVVLSG